MRFALAVATLIFAGIPGSPAAAQAADAGRSGAYLGAGGLALFDDFDAEIFGLDLEADDTWGLQARAGYRVNRWLAVEGLFEWFDETDLDLGTIDDFATVEAWTLTANLKLYPLAGRLQPYAVAGVGVLGGDFEALGFSENDQIATARLGLGLDAYASDSVVLVLEGAFYLVEDAFDLAGDDLDDLNFFTLGLGLQYRF